jgi:hypothetical protein
VTYKTDEGELLVTATAGGTTTVGANQQVTIGTNQTAPQATNQPPAPAIVVSAPAGVGFALTAPSGATCGSVGNKSAFRCIATATGASLRDPAAGRYVLMISAASAQTATLTVEAFRGGTREASRPLIRTYAVGDLVRTGFAFGGGTPLTLSELDAPELVASICAGQALGRVFGSGTLEERITQLEAFAGANKGQPIAFVVTDVDLARSASANVPSDIPITIDDLRATIDASGVHFSGKATASILTVTAATDLLVGSVDGKLALRIRSLRADPLPPALLDNLRAQVQTALADISSAFPFPVRQVVLRQGCLAVIGTTP